MDTGGKDGCVKHVFSRVDPQGIDVAAFKKPTEEELGHDFLWRVHKRVPGSGQIVIFNRSHYEDIIAVRVKKLAGEDVWKRRYRHVIDFERMLAEEGTTIIKMFLHISKDEQKKPPRLPHWPIPPSTGSSIRTTWPTAPAGAISRRPTRISSRRPAPSRRRGSSSPATGSDARNLVVARIMVDTLRGLRMDFPQPGWDPKAIKIE